MTDVVGLSALVTAVGASLALVIKAVTTSRCSQIKTPCFVCIREVPDVEPADVEPAK
jgi:hypothetical protein